MMNTGDLLIAILVYLHATQTRELVQSLIGVANRDKGDIVIIDSKNETFKSIDIETGSPGWIGTSVAHNEFYVRDHDYVYIYNSITFNRIDFIHTNCSNRHNFQHYDEYMHRLWFICDNDFNILIIDMTNRQVIDMISVTYVPFHIRVSMDYAFVTGILDTSMAIIVKYSKQTYVEMNRNNIGYATDPHLYIFPSDHKSNPSFIYSTAENLNLVYKIDTNNLQTTETLSINGAHGIFGTNDGNLYIGDSPGYVRHRSTLGVIRLINSIDMTIIKTFKNNSIIGHVHDLVINCEGNKLFVAHTLIGVVSVFDINISNNEIIGHNRIIYDYRKSHPNLIEKICVYDKNTNYNNNVQVKLKLFNNITNSIKILQYGNLYRNSWLYVLTFMMILFLAILATLFNYFNTKKQTKLEKDLQ